jgi:hypothetical protein
MAASPMQRFSSLSGRLFRGLFFAALFGNQAGTPGDPTPGNSPATWPPAGRRWPGRRSGVGASGVYRYKMIRTGDGAAWRRPFQRIACMNAGGPAVGRVMLTAGLLTAGLLTAGLVTSERVTFCRSAGVLARFCLEKCGRGRPRSKNSHSLRSADCKSLVPASPGRERVMQQLAWNEPIRTDCGAGVPPARAAGTAAPQWGRTRVARNEPIRFPQLRFELENGGSGW